MMSFSDSIKVLAKFAIITIAISVFFISLITNREIEVCISGVVIITYIIYRKFKQTALQYQQWKQLPDQMKDIIMNNDLDSITKKEKNTNDEEDIRGYR